MTMPDYRAWIILFILIPGHGAESVIIRGSTRSGMPLEGNVVAIENGRVLLHSLRGDGPVQWGIPLIDLARIGLVDQVVHGDSLLVQLEEALPLLPKWDQPTLIRLLKAIRLMAAKGNWPTTYKWSTRLLELNQHGDLEADLLLLKAQALLGMGLVQGATTAGEALKTFMDPMDYPPEFCDLMARLARQAENDDEARAWSLLPALQIPALVPPPTNGNNPTHENPLNP